MVFNKIKGDMYAINVTVLLKLRNSEIITNRFD